jgi:hypothetical protein
MMSSFFAKCRNAPCLVFALVLIWKVALLVLSAQPIPANDAYFYDGAVVNQLLHGGYYNPTLALALPISGTKVFCAYPPLYEALLWVWMSCFGTSAMSAMVLHLVLFAAYAAMVCLILKRLQTPVWCIHFAGIFLVLITFHDRPDSLAHLLGMLSVYAWIRSRRIFNGGSTPRGANCWLWLMALFSVLTFCTSLQIGGIYLVWLWFGMAATTLAGGEAFPLPAMAATVIGPAALMALVKFGFPELWTGFFEHARQTPSVTGWRLPDVTEILKVARTTPGIFWVAIALPWSWFKQHNNVAHPQYARHEFVLLPALLSALAVVAACLFLLTANTVGIANYLQPVIVACFLGFSATIFAGQRWLRLQIICLALAAVLGSVRGIGMSTWGVACAMDVGYPTAVRRVDTELSQLTPGSKVVMSSAFLYGAAKHGELTLIHSDWMEPAKNRLTDVGGMLALKPQKLILTQFDYYRRYQAVLDEVRGNPALGEIHLTNLAKVRPPDAYPAWRRVVQHVSWAPVIVDLTWR